MESKNTDPLKKYNWFWYSEGYINSTLNLLSTLSRSEIPENATQGLWLQPSSTAYTTIPIFYQIRHVIELVIKTTQVLNGNVVTLIHNKDVLLQGLISQYGNEEKIASQFLALAEKYYGTDFYQQHFLVKLPEDPFNTLFRFPEQRDGINYVDPSVFGRINKQLVREIFDDVSKLRGILFKFYSKASQDQAL